MLVAVLSTWILTSFDATFLDITRSRTRGLVLAVMGLGLFSGPRRWARKASADRCRPRR